MLRPVRRLVALVCLALLAGPPSLARGQEEPVDLDVVTALREEGLQRSQVMDTLWHLTDLHGPRLTNSPQQRRAAEWAAERLLEHGLENAALEPWGEFGLGWSAQRCVVEMTAPDWMPFIAVQKAWTAGLEQPVEGVPVLVEADTLEAAQEYAGQLAGKIVLSGAVREVPSPFEAAARRHDAESLAELLLTPTEEDGEGPRRRADRGRRRLSGELRDFFAAEGALAVIEPDQGRRGDYGVVMIGAGGSRDPAEPRALPQVVVAAEQYQRVVRLLERGHEVRLRVDVAATFHDDDLQGHNVVAEIPGSDPRIGDEVVILGAHFDSWHAGTGATDNGASCAVVMEAARLVKTLGKAPRRTIRVVLWTGEEQGLLGSKGYVEQHFGDRETMALLPGHEKLAAYFNLDNGAGRIRGVYLEGNAAVRPIFAAWLEPFADLEATTLSLRGTGGTDHLSFDALGLPGFQFIQDPMDYGSRTHHTNMDLYERVHPGDVAQAAVILATFAWHAAMRDERLPRKPLPAPRETPAADDEAPTAEASGDGGPAAEPAAAPATPSGSGR